MGFMALKKRKAINFLRLWNRPHDRGSTSAVQGTVVFLFSAKVAVPCSFLEGHCGKWIV